MQNAKDSFYEVLRGRLANINPERTVVLRGATRPALIVDENETASSAEIPDCFHMRWTEQQTSRQGELPLVVLTCQVRYATSGSKWNGGLDRGRMLATMDAELQQMVEGAPQSAPKQSYSGLSQGTAPKVLSTRLWWSSISWEAAEMRTDCLERTAVVQVMAYQETGEG